MLSLDIIYFDSYSPNYHFSPVIHYLETSTSVTVNSSLPLLASVTLLLFCHLWVNLKPSLLSCSLSSHAPPPPWLPFLSILSPTADHLTIPGPLCSHLCILLSPCHRISVLGQSCNWMPLHFVVGPDPWTFLGEISECLQLAMDFLLDLHVLIYLRYIFSFWYELVYFWGVCKSTYIHVETRGRFQVSSFIVVLK